jgi:transcriptional regulator with XRE-family HTH domain
MNARFSGMRVTEWRLYMSMTITEISEKTGIDKGRLSRFERGTGNLNQKQIGAVANALGICPGLFFWHPPLNLKIDG